MTAVRQNASNRNGGIFLSGKPIILVSLALAGCLLLSSCNKRLVLVDKTETTTAQPAASETYGYVTDTTTAPGGETTTIDEYIIDNTPTISGQGSYRQINMDAATVLALYRSAMNDVKAVAPGFNRTETQLTDDVVAGNGNSQLANSILNLVASSILQGSDGNSSHRVIKGDKTEVTSLFPLYGENDGCTLFDTAIVNSAICYGNDSEYKIVITLNDCLNPDESGDFSKILKPVDISAMKNGISQYFVVLDYSQFQFDMNYTGCEITCVLDKNTSRMKSLSQKMVIDVAININMDLGVWKTDVVKCTGTITDHTDFTDFNW